MILQAWRTNYYPVDCLWGGADEKTWLVCGDICIQKFECHIFGNRTCHCRVNLWSLFTGSDKVEM